MSNPFAFGSGPSDKDPVNPQEVDRKIKGESPSFSVGNNDLNPSLNQPRRGISGNEIGPNHPGFNIPDFSKPNDPTIPRGAIPPNADYDPPGPPGVFGEPDPDHTPFIGNTSGGVSNANPFQRYPQGNPWGFQDEMAGPSIGGPGFGLRGIGNPSPGMDPSELGIGRPGMGMGRPGMGMGRPGMGMGRPGMGFGGGGMGMGGGGFF